jgi:hypothetical protein
VALLVFSAMAVGGMAASTYRLARGDEGWRTTALFTAGVCLVIAGLTALAGVQLAGLTCDESCYGPGWRHTPDAWQWQALPILSISGFALLALAARLLLIRRYRPSLAALVVAVVPFVPFAVLLFEL